MKTITVQIGNSDDKLSQQRWCMFVRATDDLIRRHAWVVHFFGLTPSDDPWQTAAWVIQAQDDNAEILKVELTGLRARFDQNSVAWMEGETDFI